MNVNKLERLVSCMQIHKDVAIGDSAHSWFQNLFHMVNKLVPAITQMLFLNTKVQYI